MLVWRLSHRAHSAFDGEGGLVQSGRWHRVGVRIIYTSEHLSLAALEFFVNIGPDEQPVQLAGRSAEIPDDVPRDRLTADRPRSEEHTSELQSLAYLVCRLLLEKKKK